MNINYVKDYAELQEVKQAVTEYRAHISEMPTPRNVFLESLRTTCGWATDVTDIMLSLIEGSTGPLPDYAKKEIDTFTGKIEQDYFLQCELMYSVGYQKLLTHKHLCCREAYGIAASQRCLAASRHAARHASRLYSLGRGSRPPIRGTWTRNRPQRDSNPGQVSLQPNPVPQSYSNKVFKQ